MFDRKRKHQSGNIFFALFGAVALIGILGAGVMTFMKGPLATSVKITRINTAETQMALGAQVAVMAAANTATSGDCDSDGYVEPLEWRDAGALPKPTGAGLVPMSIGMTKKDPWGTEYGYCAWDVGTYADAGCGGGSELRLEGDSAGGAYPVVALVSAGPDKTFTTTCRDFATADVNSDGDLLDAGDLPLVSKAAETDDDIIFSYTYDEATGASGGLWSIKSGSPDTAYINKKIEASGVANLQGGVLLPDSSLITCDATTAGVMAKNASGGIEICDGAGAWDTISGGGATSALDTGATCTGPSDAGNVRYNTATSLPEFCDGVDWRPFTLASQTANLVITPSSDYTMDVDGSNNLDTVNCVSPWSCGAEVTFTIQNNGGAASTTLPAANVTTSDFVITSDTCSGIVLDPMDSCVVTVRPKANGNYTYLGQLQMLAENMPIAILSGEASLFGCSAGVAGGGGIYAECGLPSTEGTYDLVVMPGGCTGSTTNPTCSGGTDTVTKSWASTWDTTVMGGQVGDSTIYSLGYYYLKNSEGAQNSVNAEHIMAISPSHYNSLAFAYCNDMVYGGYSDWYLPSSWELMNYIYPHKTAIGGFVTTSGTYYMSSTFYSYYGTNQAQPSVVTFYNGTDSTTTQWSTRYIRCTRRDNVALPVVPTDTDPNDVSFAPAVTFTSGGSATSNTVTVAGILQTVSVSITGGAGMDIVKNGSSTGSSSITGVTNGDTLAFTMDAPTVLGTQNTATITIGDDTYTWSAGYADSSRIAHIFVTSTTYTANSIGGLVGADAICNARAAASSYSLSSSWKALLSTSTINAADHIPWNWGTLKTVTGNTVVTGGFPDLWDGNILTTIPTELGGSASLVWTSTSSSGAKDTDFFQDYGMLNSCLDWTTSGLYYAGCGNSVSTTSAWIKASNCALSYCSVASRSVYCFEDIDSASDTTPNDLTIPYNVQVTASSREDSDAVTISGMSASATATLSVTATGGTPTFSVNGGAEVTSASVSNGDSVVFHMTAPASDNSSYKMTITANGSTTLGYWRVWTGDSTGTATKKMFVTSTSTYNGNFGGVGGADSTCTSVANLAGLTGTWHAVLSGQNETEWAVNRVGYNWSTLTNVSGQTLTTAGNLWSGAALSNPILTQAGAVLTNKNVYTNTYSNGVVRSTSDYYNCANWTSNNGFTTYNKDYFGNSSSYTSSNWIYTSSTSAFCSGSAALYCIEQ